LEQFDAGEFAFGVGGVLLHGVAVLAQFGELVGVGEVAGGFFGEPASKVGLEEAVDSEVGVASDRAGEVAVVSGGEGVVAHGGGAGRG